MQRLTQWVLSILRLIPHSINLTFKKFKMALSKSELLALITSKIYSNTTRDVSGDDVADVANEIVEAVFDANLWELDGATNIKPISDRDVTAATATINTGLTLDYLSFTGGSNSRMKLAIDPDGDVIAGETKMDILSTGTSSDQDILYEVAFINSANNYTYTLQSGEANVGKEITVRKASDVAYDIDIEVRAGEILLIDDTASAGISASAKGAWIKLKAYYDGTNAGWAVIMDSGDWTGFV
jgi:hypothetical protein